MKSTKKKLLTPSLIGIMLASSLLPATNAFAETSFSIFGVGNYPLPEDR